MPKQFHYKRISDAIHGSIGLSEVEARVVESPAFQRLHNVKQLGLANLVFPGAGYSRFSHSIGACHNASQLVDAIGRNTGELMKPERKQAFRLVGLLHDIGHYPFSHATEHVISNYYVETELLSPAVHSLGGAATAQLANPPGAAVAPTSQPAPVSYGHEDVGVEVIRNDPEIGRILDDAGIGKDDIADLFAGQKPDNLIGIISSDLDCDRLDYLRRTAHFSGAPYGSVDIDFIIDHATLDVEGRFCLLPKALRAADHLLVSRYYDYMQVPFHKTVAALEWSLVSCLRALLERGILDCSGAAIKKAVCAGEWCHFDDQQVFEHFKKLLTEVNEGDPELLLLRDHIHAITRRRPAKLVEAWEEIRLISDRRTATQMAKLATIAVDSIASRLGIDRRRLYVWSLPLKMSKLQDRATATDEQLAEAVHILDPETGRSEVLNEFRETILSQLGKYHYSGLRIYYLPPDGRDDKGLIQQIKSDLIDAIGHPRASG